MFTRARFRLTLLYLLLLGGTLALVAGAILVLGVRQARRADDLELRLSADGLGARAAAVPVFVPTAPFRDDRDRRPQRDTLQERRPFLEAQGTLAYLLPVVSGVLSPGPAGTVAGLPDLDAAAAAMAANAGRYQTISIEDGTVRVYSVPVHRDGRTVAVAQSARSQYFVQSSVKRLLVTVLGAGATGLVLSGGASFWLAGRTLRPIAAALQRQRDFTADASHELRTPLTLVRGNAELLLRHPDRPIGDYEDVVQDIVGESERLTRLIAGLLTLARVDDGRLALDERPIDLSALAANLVREFEPLAAARGVTMRAQIAPSVVVTADADRVREIGGILIENALRYAVASPLTVAVALGGAWATLAVTDCGPGIAPEHLPRIFERFYRVDAARSSDDGGLGLGLAIAQSIAQAHRGRIEVRSVVGQGSTFTLFLPRKSSAGRDSRDGVSG